MIDELNKFYYFYHKKFLQQKEIDVINTLPLDRFCKIQITNNIYIELFPFLTWGNTYKKIHKAYIGKCDGFSGQIQIKCNGDVLPCCYDVDSKLVVGNVFDEKLSIIKEKVNYKKVERNILSKWICYDICRVCQGNSEIITLWKQQLATLFCNKIEERFVFSHNKVILNEDRAWNIGVD